MLCLTVDKFYPLVKSRLKPIVKDYLQSENLFELIYNSTGSIN